MSETDGSKPVLFLSGGGTMQAAWQPLAERFRLAFLAPQAAQLARQSHLPAISLGEFADADTQEAAASVVARLVHRLVEGMPAIEARCGESFGAERPHDLNGNFDNWWPGFCLHHLREQTTRLAAMEQLFAKHPVIGCLTHEDVTIDMRTMVLFAKAKGVPTIHIPHAPCHLLDSAGADIHRETRTDWIAASGPLVAEWYARQGFPRERIEIVGGPQWDWLYAQLPTKREARRVLGTKSERVILYGTTWAQTTALRSRFEREQDDTLTAVLKLAQAWQADLIISVHPNEHPKAEEYYAEAMRLAEVEGMVTRKHVPYTVRAADVVIEHGPSNFCLDAAILGTPSCYVQTEGFDYATRLPFRGGVEDLSQMAEQAAASAGDPEWQDFIAAYNAAHPDGGAAERLAEYVGRIVE